jgi:hypothetical protein
MSTWMPSRTELVRRLQIDKTPTVLVLDHAGRIVRRATAMPRRGQIVAAVAYL